MHTTHYIFLVECCVRYANLFVKNDLTLWVKYKVLTLFYVVLFPRLLKLSYGSPNLAEPTHKKEIYINE